MWLAGRFWETDVAVLPCVPEDKDAVCGLSIGVLEMTWLVIVPSGLAKHFRISYLDCRPDVIVVPYDRTNLRRGLDMWQRVRLAVWQVYPSDTTMTEVPADGY
jgi:hypothetical protein